MQWKNQYNNRKTMNQPTKDIKEERALLALNICNTFFNNESLDMMEKFKGLIVAVSTIILQASTKPIDTCDIITKELTACVKHLSEKKHEQA